MKKLNVVVSLMLGTLPVFTYAVNETGAGTRGGGEIVYVNGQPRFRDLVDDTLYECVPPSDGVITRNPHFNALMESFARSNFYAERMFEHEAKKVIVCYVNAPLRYIPTEDYCRVYRPFSERAGQRDVVGVRLVNSPILVVNRGLLETMQNGQNPSDVGAFFTHEVARSFVDYTVEGNCHNNTDVRNLTGLIVRNHQTTLTPERFNFELGLYTPYLPVATGLFDSLKPQFAALDNPYESIGRRIEAATALRLSGARLDLTDTQVVNQLLDRPAHKLVLAIQAGDLAAVRAYAGLQANVHTIRMSLGTGSDSMSALSFALKQRNLAMYRLLRELGGTSPEALAVRSQVLYELLAQGDMPLVVDGLGIADVQADLSLREFMDAALEQIRVYFNEASLESMFVRLGQMNLPFNWVDYYDYAVSKYYRQAILIGIQHTPEGQDLLNHANDLGDTIVTMAIVRGDAALLNDLIAQPQFNPTHVRVGGDTYLHVAVLYFQFDILRVLRDRFPLLRQVQNGAGRTALQLAREFRIPQAVEILR